MKKKYINLLIISFLLFFLSFIITNPIISKTSIIASTSLWFCKVLPNLFPMFILSDLLINYNFIYYLNFVLNPIMKKLFKTNGYLDYILFMSLLSGFPSNAKWTKELYELKYISIKEANKILCFSFFPNPIFVIGITYPIFNNLKIPYLILISQYLGNIIIGFILRNYYISNDIKTKQIIFYKSFNQVLVSSIKKAIDTLLLILGTIIVSNLFYQFIKHNLNLNNYLGHFLSGILEITNGINNISLLNISHLLKAIFITFFISFGGICIHTQIKSILNDTFNYKMFFKFRIFHGLISSIIIFILQMIL